MFENDITVQWMGCRKDSGRGSFTGWFVMKDSVCRPLLNWEKGTNKGKEAPCFVFWGKVGKNIFIERREITPAFIDEMAVKQKNFKTVVESHGYLAKCGRIIHDEISMFILMAKLKDDDVRVPIYNF